jgi:hypothetical protein
MQSCGASTLGYACSQQFGSVLLHWTTNATVPPNVCTGVKVTDTVDPTEGVLHMAVEAKTTGARTRVHCMRG